MPGFLVGQIGTWCCHIPYDWRWTRWESWSRFGGGNEEFGLNFWSWDVPAHSWIHKSLGLEINVWESSMNKDPMMEHLGRGCRARAKWESLPEQCLQSMGAGGGARAEIEGPGIGGPKRSFPLPACPSETCLVHEEDGSQRRAGVVGRDFKIRTGH